jgi:hypothetical protein
MKTYTIRKGEMQIQLDFLSMMFGTYAVTAYQSIECYGGNLLKEPLTIWKHETGFTEDFIKLKDQVNDNDLNDGIEQILIKEIK